MYFLAHPLFLAFQPVMIRLCFATAWALVFLVLYDLWTFGRRGIKTLKRMHRIPCANCHFFTGDYHLKCTVHPKTALSEDAINCHDFMPHSRNVFH
jgi:hypothetical protein